jgi:hypothetical protein
VIGAVDHDKAGVEFFNFPPAARSGGLASAVIYLRYELNDCRCYAPDQKAKYDDDDRFGDWPPH